MVVKKQSDIPSSEITPEELTAAACTFMKRVATVAGAAAALNFLPQNVPSLFAQDANSWKPSHPSSFDTTEELTPFKDIVLTR